MNNVKKEITKEESNNNNESKKKLKNVSKKVLTRKTIVVFLAIVAIVVGCIIYRGNYIESEELGENFLAAFKKSSLFIAITFVINFVFLFLSFFITNKTIKKGIKIFFDDEKKPIPKFPNKSICFIISLIGSALTSNMILEKAILCISNSKVGINDSIFNFDISFFMFIKPFVNLILLYLLVVTIATLIYGIIYSIILLNTSFDGVSRETITKCDLPKKVGSRVRIIAILVALIILNSMGMNIGNERFMSIELNDGTGYSLYGAGFVDAKVKLWGYAILAVLAIYSILKTYKAIRDKILRSALGNILIVPIYLIIMSIVLAGCQLILVGSNEFDKNEIYIKQNIDSTKKAFGLSTDNISIDYSGTITKDEINENSLILNNMPIVTSGDVLQDLQTTQTYKGYYSYRKTQMEKYNTDGIDTLVYITPREILNSNTSYNTKTYSYTHGYGAMVTLAGSTNVDGNLNNIQTNFGDLSNASIKTTQPRIYYGLETNNFVVLNDDMKEFDYPDEEADTTATYTYDGNAGIKLNWLDRLIVGMKEGDISLAFSSNTDNDSKILINRNIINRAKLAMPYLKYDDNPYMVVDNKGDQYWVIDAYTTSNEYPFSQKIDIGNGEQINYIRNSAKVIVNAYDGTMKFYIIDRTDPIIMAYNNIYPELFESKDSVIPEDISSHFVYPKYLFDIQSKLVEKYHNIAPENLYRANDIWNIANTLTSGKQESMDSYYTMVNVDNKNAIGLMIPYTYYGKQHMSGYLVGTYIDGVPKLKLYSFLSNSNVLGPVQLETQINQDGTIASEIASLNVTGTKITKNMIVVPINNTVIYIETIYQQLVNETVQRPTLKKVVVSSGNRVAIGNTLEDALNNLLSKYAVDITVKESENVDELIKSIIKTNKNIKSSSQSGDWKLFGDDMNQLTDLIDQLEKVVDEEEKNKNDESTNKIENKDNVNTNVVD